jgi:hypothetical protein
MPPPRAHSSLTAAVQDYINDADLTMKLRSLFKAMAQPD